jgi:hypothetical protein
LLAKPVLESNILSLDPTELAQLLPKRLQENRATGSGASIQKTYAKDFACLLCVSGRANRKEYGAKGKDSDFFLHVFCGEQRRTIT